MYIISCVRVHRKGVHTQFFISLSAFRSSNLFTMAGTFRTLAICRGVIPLFNKNQYRQKYS